MGKRTFEVRQHKKGNFTAKTTPKSDGESNAMSKAYQKKESYWLEDYALFTAIKQHQE